MPRIPEFFETLQKIAQLHEAKNQDYATSADPFSNFVFTETALELFRNNADKTFVWPIATKLARLSVLLSKTGLPNFESIEDSFDDIATYVILWKCAYMRAHNPQAQYPEPDDELIKVRIELAEFIDTLSEVETNRLYEVVRKMKAQSQAQQGPQQYAAEPLGRLNYAGQSDQGKHPGQSHFHNPERRTTTADERVRAAVDNDRKQDPRSGS